jgi:hypothetical protein
MRGHGCRLAATLSVVIGIAAAAALGGAPAGASVAGASCPPVSATQLHAILGFPQSLQTRNTVDSGRADHYLCNGVAWSGPAPSTRQAALQKAKAGQGAAFGIEAWTPNEGSPDADRWPDDYDKLTGRFDIEGVTFPGLFTNMGWPSKHVKPSHFGYQTTGMVVTVGSGPAKGLVAAVGCWWNDNALSAVCLMVEEAAGKPVVKHLNQLAAIAVKKVL